MKTLKMKTLGSMKFVCGLAIAAAFALSTPAYAGVEAGKAMFDNSCINCHGKAGAGNPAQDKFWNMRIPRLGEDYVQKKPDDEIRDVILNGRRKMPAAVQGKPHTDSATKVKPEQVPDLIAYIRTLKKK